MKVIEYLFLIPIAFAFFFVIAGVFSGRPVTANQVVGSLFTSILTPWNTGNSSIWAAIGGILAFAVGTVLKNDSLTSFTMTWTSWNLLFSALIVIGQATLTPLVFSGTDVIAVIVFIVSVFLDIGIIFAWSSGRSGN